MRSSLKFCWCFLNYCVSCCETELEFVPIQPLSESNVGWEMQSSLAAILIGSVMMHEEEASWAVELV